MGRSKSEMGHSRRFRDVNCESALPPRTDIVSLTGNVGKGPSEADIRAVFRHISFGPEGVAGLEHQYCLTGSKPRRAALGSLTSLIREGLAMIVGYTHYR
jgi:hypothetical protein